MPLLGSLVPSALPLEVTWTIVATGDDDRILSFVETPHNIPTPPRLLRALGTTAITTAGLAISGWRWWVGVVHCRLACMRSSWLVQQLSNRVMQHMVQL